MPKRMKKITLICLFLLVFIGLRAQSYIPFPAKMVVYGHSHYTLSMGDSYWVPHRTEINSDTLIGAYHYAIVYSGVSPVSKTGGIRNDTLNKKVYFYSFTTNTEKVFYDFDLSVGDTVNATSGFGFYDQLVVTEMPPMATLDTAWVTSIDSVLMPHDGLYHKRFRFNGIYHGLMPPDVLVDTTDQYWMQPGGPGSMVVTSLVEGVGQLYNPLSYFGEFEYVNSFHVYCASINGISVVTPGGPPPPFMSNIYCDQLYMGLNEIDKSININVYPNPTTGLFQIKTELEITSIEVLDIFGRRIYYSEKNQTEINISDFENGIYFVRIHDSKGDSVVKKIVKH